MALHANLTTGDLHSVCNYSYANETLRLAATGFISADVGKFAYQIDNKTIWLLTGYSPITWREINTGGASELPAHSDSHSLSGSDEITVENLGTDGDKGTVLTSDGDGNLSFISKYGERVLEVGADQRFTTISSALTAAAALTPTDINPVLILLSPGLYAENNTAGPLQLLDYVHIQGLTQHNGVIVAGYDDTKFLFQSATNGHGNLSNMVIAGMDGIGGGAILVNSGQYTTCMNVNFAGNMTAIQVTGSGVSAILSTIQYISNVIGLQVDSDAYVIVNGCLSTGAILYSFVVDGGALELSGIDASGTGGSSIGCLVDNSGQVEINNGRFNVFNTAIQVGPDGGTVRMGLLRILDSVTYDLNFLGDATWNSKACEFTYSKVNVDESATVERTILDHPAKEIIVAKDGGDFASIKEANDSITDNSSSNPYVIEVYPGVYVESPFTVKDYISIKGQGGSYFGATLITTDVDNHFITLGAGCLLENLAVVGPTATGKAAFYFGATSYIPAELFRILIMRGYYGIFCDSSTFGSINAFYCVPTYIGTNMEKFVYATNAGKIYIGGCGIAGLPPYTLATGIEASGASSQVTLNGCQFGVVGGTAVRANDGASIRISSSSITLGSYGLRIGSTGTGSKIFAIGCDISSSVTNNIYTDTNTGIIQFSGSADKNKITVSSGTNFSASFTDATTGEEGQVVFGELWLGSPNGSTPLGSYMKATASTGLASGGDITKTTGRGISIAAGTVYEIDDTNIVKATWSTTPLTLTANQVSIWIQVDNAGTVSEVFIRPDDTAVVVLGLASTDASNVTFLSTRSAKLSQQVASRHIYSRDVIGPISVSGCTTTKNSYYLTSLQIDVDNGSYYIFDNLKTATGDTPITFSYWYRKSGGGWNIVPNQTDFDSGYYDDGSGTLAAIPGTSYKRDLVFAVVNGSGTDYHVVYAQETHAAAVDCSNNPVPPDVLINNALRLSSIIVQKSATDIYSITDQRPKLGQLSSGSTSITSHSGLSGLGADDHTQYQLRTERNSASGYCGLNASSQVAAAQLPITNSSPANVTKAAAVVGTSTDLARSDHKHDITTATAVAVTTANAEGSSTSLARADHAHEGLTRSNSDFNGFTAKTTVIGSDILLIEDSESDPAYAKKKILLSYLPKKWPYSTVLTVDKTSANADYSTIQAAITAASAGTTILVSPGDYSEALTLKDGVDIIGLSPHGVGARGGYSTTNTGVNIKTLSSAVPITLSTGSASIQGCGIYQERAGQTATFKTVVMSGTKLLLKDCRIEQDGSAWPDGSTFYTIEQTAGQLNLVNCEIISPPEYSTIPIYGLYIHGASTTCNAYNCKFSPNISTTYQCNIYINHATATVNLNGCLVQGDCVKTLGTLNLYGGNQLDNGVTTEWGWPDLLDGTYATFKTWDCLRRDGSLPVYKLPCALTTGDIGSPNNGDIWYNNTTGKFRARENSSTINLIPASAVFGQDYQSVTVSARTTTTSNSYQTRVTLTTPALTGTYRVAWSAITDLGTTTNLQYTRLYNNTDAVAYEEVINRCAATTERWPNSGINYVTFTDSAKTFYLQWRSGTNGNTSGIAMAKIELWRVA